MVNLKKKLEFHLFHGSQKHFPSVSPLQIKLAETTVNEEI